MIRALLLLVAAAALASESAGAKAQQSVQAPIVGVLLVFWAPDDYFVPSVRKGLSDLGYIDGRNVKIEYRSAQGHLDQLPRLAEDLVRLGARVIVVGTAPAVRASKQASGVVPIVFALHDTDPLASGLIDSFGRPGGNVTGIFTLQSELVGKRLELLKEALPNVSRVAVFWDASSRNQLVALEPAARALGIRLQHVELRAPYDFAAAFRIAKKNRAEAVMVMFSPAFIQLRAKVTKAALENRLPTIYQDDVSVIAGGLMSYGPSSTEPIERTGYYIDRILKGEKVSELPVEQASTFRLFINLNTAKALGMTIPESILLRADDVVK